MNAADTLKITTEDYAALIAAAAVRFGIEYDAHPFRDDDGALCVQIERTHPAFGDPPDATIYAAARNADGWTFTERRWLDGTKADASGAEPQADGIAIVEDGQ